MTYSEFLFPNDLHIVWSLMIVTYPFITGIIAGAFIASALFHVFGRNELEPVSRFALLLSLSFMLCATLPLLNHLGHPERAFNIVITPNFRSAIAGFGFIYTFYLIILTMEIWLSYREDIIHCYHNATSRSRRAFWGTMALWILEVTPEARRIDQRGIYVLGLIGIPAACTLHGYVGFLFGSLKSNPWWSTPLMPQVFLLSAIQSGLAMLILLYLYLGAKGILEKSYECLRSLCFYLWLTIVFYIISEGLELLFFFYESSDAWFVISTLLVTRLWYTFVVVQVGIGVSVPFILLTLMLFLGKFEKTFASLAGISAVIALLEVWMMRWNIVIGGQQFSKSFVGFREYTPLWFEKEGIAATIFINLLPLIVLYILSRFFSIKAATYSAMKGASTHIGSKMSGGEHR